MSNHQTRHKPWVRPGIDALWGGMFIVLLFIVFALLMGTASTGCASTSRTETSPASTNATHETSTQRPGRTIRNEYKLEMTPPAPAGGGTGTQAEPRSTGAGQAGFLSSSSPATPAVYQMSDLAMGGGKALGGDRRMAPLTPVAYSSVGSSVGMGPERQPRSVEDAIRDAVDQGYGVKLEHIQTEEIPLTTETSASMLDDRGPGLKTTSDEAAIGFDGSRSGASLPWGGASGKTKWGLDASLISRGVNPLMIIGAIVMIAAIIPVVSPPRRWFAAGIVALTGMLIIAAGVVSEQAPWVFVLAILAFLGVAGWLGYEAWRNKRRQVALTSIVRGVDTPGGEPASKIIKEYIAKSAGDELTVVKSEVNATKAKARIANTT